MLRYILAGLLFGIAALFFTESSRPALAHADLSGDHGYTWHTDGSCGGGGSDLLPENLTILCESPLG
jgi:hypothetical protein